MRWTWSVWLIWVAATAAAGCKRPAEERRETAVTAPGPEQGHAQRPEQAPAPSPEQGLGESDEPAEPAPARPEAGTPAGDLGPVSAVLGAVPAELARSLTLERVARGLKRPVGLVHAPGDRSGRLFVIEQHEARVRILRPGPGGLVADREPFLDLGGQVARGNEQGLLGLAFHPRFADNGKLYINYTDRRGTTHVVEYRVDRAQADRVDMATARSIFTLDQPYSNHNAGHLEFGLDGKLYVGTGDGGAAGDPLGAGQDRQSLLAKMLRFDVDAPAHRPEIVQMGLRNPWRYHFDARTGDLYIADVGQNKWEFVYVVAADDIDGHNFGWNVVEGNRCYKNSRCDPSRFTPAVIEYDHATGCSITGGVVYRGRAIPELHGVYFYADFCTALVRSFRWARDGVRQHWDWKPALDPRRKLAEISAFGTDADGELYILSLQGDIYKLVRR